MWTTADVIASLPSPRVSRLPAPAYTGSSGVGIFLAVESLRQHMTSESAELQDGLAAAGYHLCGRDLPTNETDVPKILARHPDAGVAVVMDKREWDLAPRDFRDQQARFTNTHVLADRPDLFRLTILKDAQQRPLYHREAAQEIGCHAWIIYYAPAVVAHLAPYLRPKHCIRTYHTVNSTLVPTYFPNGRRGCLLSGAMSHVYPLRQRLRDQRRKLPEIEYLPHPGYHRRGSATPGFLKQLSRFRVAICTASIYGYALRKIVEATACGCVVITDLPVDEVMPKIDGNLVRVSPDVSTEQVAELIRQAYDRYDPAVQEYFACLARGWYDYRLAGKRLAADIETLRANYS